MWLPNSAARDHADRALLRDVAVWGGNVHAIHSRVLLAAIQAADGVDERKAVSSRLILTQLSALIALGQLYVAVRDRSGRPIAQSRLAAGLDEAREALQRLARDAEPSIWELLHLPAPDSPQLDHVNAEQRVAYTGACEERSTSLKRVSTILRENMLLATIGSDPARTLLVSGPKIVSEIKTGRENESEAQGETAFLITDASDGSLRDAGDLVVVACPTRLPVLEGIADDTEFIANETAATAHLVGLAMDLGQLEG